jgi:hypothetical protein
MDGRDFDALVQTGTVTGRSACQADRQVKRMQMTGSRVKTAAAIIGTRHHPREFFTIDKANVLVGVPRTQMLDMLASSCGVTLAMVDVQVAKSKITRNAVGLNQPVKVGTGLQRKFPQATRVDKTELLLEPLLLAPHAHMRLATVSARGPPAQKRLLDQQDIYPAPG